MTQHDIITLDCLKTIKYDDWLKRTKHPEPLQISPKKNHTKISLPLFAFLCCVALTMIFNFGEANRTHCNVYNVFPSISACIGNYEPQRLIWAGAVYAHAPFRFFIIYLRWQYYKRTVKNDLGIIVNLVVLLNIVENVTLLGLTRWSSTENYQYHEVCFKIFIGTSLFYMFFSCLLLTMYRRTQTLIRREKHSLRIKKQAFLVNIGSFSCAAYFFLRHNKLCEPYVYSLFALSEYIVVISNIVFHLTTVFDIPRLVIYINKYGFSIE